MPVALIFRAVIGHGKDAGCLDFKAILLAAFRAFHPLQAICVFTGLRDFVWHDRSPFALLKKACNWVEGRAA